MTVDKIHSAVPSALTACLSFNYRKTRAGCCFAMQVYGGRRSPKESEWMHIRSTLPSAAGKNINKQSTGSDLATQCNSSCKVDLFFFFSFFFWPDSHNILEALRRGQHSSRFTAEKCEEVQMNHVTPVFPVQLEGPAGCSKLLCKPFH